NFPYTFYKPGCFSAHSINLGKGGREIKDNFKTDVRKKITQQTLAAPFEHDKKIVIVVSNYRSPAI
ncbi:hypothetical protein X975_21227, partial [Stegodyphus mimosarum]